jgi:hypothetical protein
MSNNQTNPVADKNTSRIRAAINDRVNRPSAVDEIKKGNKEKTDRKMAWTGEIREYWYIYLLLVISAIFTATLGLFMGLSPHLVTLPDGSQVIQFNTDLTHWLLAILYMVAFVGTTELQFAISKHLFSQREEGNPSQTISMLVAMVIAVVGIIGTGIAGGFVVASNIAFLSDFREIPHAAQKWVIIVIPVMLAVYSVLYLVYSQSSESAQADRLIRDEEKRMRRDHKLQMMHAQLAAEGVLMDEEIDQFWTLVENKKITAGQARAAIRAGKTLGDLEQELNRDLDENGIIGNRTAPAAQLPPPIIARSRHCVICGKPSGRDMYCSDECAQEDKVPVSKNGNGKTNFQ